MVTFTYTPAAAFQVSAITNDFSGANNYRPNLKNLPITTGMRLQLRLEAFNLFDRVNFTPPASNRSEAGFGTTTTTFDARQVQLGVKLLW